MGAKTLSIDEGTDCAEASDAAERQSEEMHIARLLGYFVVMVYVDFGYCCLCRKDNINFL